MATLADLISETENDLLAGDRDEVNQLTNSCDNAVTSLTFTYDLNGIQAGAYIAIDLEVMYVWSTDDTQKTVTVQRGMLGSTPAAHSAGAITYVDPKFSKWTIAKAINQEIRDLSTPPNGLFQVKNFTLTTQPVQKTYTIPAPNTDLIDVLEIRYQPPGPALKWDRIARRYYQILRQMPTTGSGGFTTGMGLRIEPALYPGRVMTVRYAAPFTELAALTDDAAGVSGLPPTALDIPPLGAAARLMGVREAKRAFLESTMDTRRASEVPVGASARSAQAILSILNERIRTEYMRLVQQWPDMR